MSGNGTFVGFGFGAIQSGLFVYEAWRSGNFNRIVVADVVPALVEGVRRNGGRYALNVATPAGIEINEVGPVDILNPLVEGDRRELVSAVAEADEMATALPSVTFYGTGNKGDVVDILGAGLRERAGRTSRKPAVIYTAENHNHAAELLEGALETALGMNPAAAGVQILNTVIGKMSGVVTDAGQIKEQALVPVTPDLPRAFLVEAFSRILVSRIDLPGFQRGIRVFEEKADLLPFEEAKLYGHNATHALLGYLLRETGAGYMSEAARRPDLLQLSREAFLRESGAALCRKFAGVDPLFTSAGYRVYVEDLMERMMNPHLRDAVIRITRDTRRKLGWDDRLVGTMRVALSQGISPDRYARGAAAALRLLAAEEQSSAGLLLGSLWTDGEPRAEVDTIRKLIRANL